MWIMFAYSGWNASTYIGSEVKDPTRNIPRSLLVGTGIVTTIYILLNLFYVYAVHPQGMEGVISIGGLAVGQAFGESVGSFVSVLIAFALFSSLSAYVISDPGSTTPWPGTASSSAAFPPWGRVPGAGPGHLAAGVIASLARADRLV